MAKAQIILGGGNSTPDISVSGKTLATPTSGTNPISTTSGSFKCDTHNCIMGGYAKGASGSSPLIYLDGDIILGAGNAEQIRLGYPDSNNQPTTYGFFIPKGKTVTTRSSGTYALYFYEID